MLSVECEWEMTTDECGDISVTLARILSRGSPKLSIAFRGVGWEIQRYRRAAREDIPLPADLARATRSRNR